MKNHVRDLRMQYDLSQDALAEKVGGITTDDYFT